MQQSASISTSTHTAPQHVKCCILVVVMTDCCRHVLHMSLLQAQDVEPMVMIQGILSNGSNLVLPARLTADRRALMTVTPDEGMPLVAGNHTVVVSLNGQEVAATLDADYGGVSCMLQWVCSDCDWVPVSAARLTTDRLALLIVTPHESMPRVVNHTVVVSLNGQEVAATLDADYGGVSHILQQLCSCCIVCSI